MKIAGPALTVWEHKKVIVAPMDAWMDQEYPQNPIFFVNGKNHQKHKNSEMSKNMTKLAIRPSTRGL